MKFLNWLANALCWFDDRNHRREWVKQLELPSAPNLRYKYYGELPHYRVPVLQNYVTDDELVALLIKNDWIRPVNNGGKTVYYAIDTVFTELAINNHCLEIIASMLDDRYALYRVGK